MRLFAVRSEGFVEYDERSFSETHLEKTMQQWMELNPQALTDYGGLLIIGREVTTDLGAYIDLLGVDREGNLAVVELKRAQTPRETLAQALEYASFVSTLDVDALESLFQSYSGDDGITLALAHRHFFGLDDQEAVSFGKDQRIVLVAAEISPAIRASAEYLNRKGVRVTCLEFSYFRSQFGEELLSTDIVVDGEARRSSKHISSASGPRTDRVTFLAGCDEAGRAMFEPILALGAQPGYSIAWGSRGFSLRVDMGDGSQRTLCIGSPQPEQPMQAKQALLLPLTEIARDFPSAKDAIESFRTECLGMGFFLPAGRGISVRYVISSVPDKERVQMVLQTLRALSELLLDANVDDVD